ncbi:hypothetical protein DFJ74DRAFT_684566 [Hyaloraphidium curvatum]|nr:hypothetical protein DFJ74DRAFT_684566 [Hyaloraphidium curvatum]
MTPSDSGMIEAYTGVPLHFPFLSVGIHSRRRDTPCWMRQRTTHFPKERRRLRQGNHNLIALSTAHVAATLPVQTLANARRTPARRSAEVESGGAAGTPYAYDFAPALEVLASQRREYEERLKKLSPLGFGSGRGAPNVATPWRSGGDTVRQRPSVSGRVLWHPDTPGTFSGSKADKYHVTFAASPSSSSRGAGNESAGSPALHVFIDNSNIFYGLLHALRERYGSAAPQARLEYHNLVGLVSRGRPVEKCCVVASEGIGQSGKVRKIFERMGFSAQGGGARGFQAIVLRRVPVLQTSAPAVLSKTPRNDFLQLRVQEQSVDEALQHAVGLSLLDYGPSTLCLVTGDGGPSYMGAEGFPGMVKRALAKGWTVEVVSWSHSLSANFLARFGHHERFSVVLLDAHLDEICFMAKDRNASSDDEV